MTCTQTTWFPEGAPPPAVLAEDGGALPRTNLPSEPGTKMEDSTLGYLPQNARPAVGGLAAANQGVCAAKGPLVGN